MTTLRATSTLCWWARRVTSTICRPCPLMKKCLCREKLVLLPDLCLVLHQCTGSFQEHSHRDLVHHVTEGDCRPHSPGRVPWQQRGAMSMPPFTNGQKPDQLQCCHYQKITRNDRSPTIKELKKKHSPRAVEGVETVSRVQQTQGKEGTGRPGLE